MKPTTKKENGVFVPLPIYQVARIFNLRKNTMYRVCKQGNINPQCGKKIFGAWVWDLEYLKSKNPVFFKSELGEST